jgi:hypothetical protein
VIAAPRTPAVSNLAAGIVAWRTGELAASAAALELVIDDVRAGSALRAIAHLYAARVATARDDVAAATRHRTAAAALATPDATWLR